MHVFLPQTREFVFAKFKYFLLAHAAERAEETCLYQFEWRLICAAL